MVARDRVGDEEFAPATPPPLVNGRCGECGGNGWIVADMAYLDRHFPWPAAPAAAALGEDQSEYEAYVYAMHQTTMKRTAAANSVYPCACRPGLYAKWKAGHFQPGHDKEECDICRPSKRRH